MSTNTPAATTAYYSLFASLPLSLTSLDLNITTALAGLGLAIVTYNALRILAAVAVYLLPSRLHLYHQRYRAIRSRDWRQRRYWLCRLVVLLTLSLYLTTVILTGLPSRP